MVLVCIVKSCTNSKSKTKEKGYKMHRFPKNISLCHKWLTTCNRADLRDKTFSNYRVCSKHFPSKMYANPEQTILLPTAVPTKFESNIVCIEPATVTEKNEMDQRTAVNTNENDAFLEEPVSSSTPRKSNPPMLETSVAASNRISISKCSQTSMCSMCTQTTRLLSANTPRCALWTEKCNSLYLPTTDTNDLGKRYKLCSLHFKDSMFSNFQKNRLFLNAVPTLFKKVDLITEQSSTNDEPIDTNLVTPVENKRKRKSFMDDFEETDLKCPRERIKYWHVSQKTYKTLKAQNTILHSQNVAMKREIKSFHELMNHLKNENTITDHCYSILHRAIC